MSDLQIWLILLGVLAIGGVLGLNWWQDRRVRRRMQENFPPSREDPLLGEKEAAAATPAPAAAPARKHREPPVTPERREPAWDGSDASSPDNAPPKPFVSTQGNASATDDADEPDSGCEAVIDLTFGQPVPGRDLYTAVRELQNVGQKPLRSFFRSSEGLHRASVRSDEDYISMQLAVQLANRRGALTATEWAQAWACAQQVADQFDAEIEGPDPRQVVDRARQLDDICAALDTSVGLTLVPQSPQPWRVQEVLSAARRVGFAESGDGQRLEWLDEQGAVRFSLTHPGAEANGNGAAVGRLSLLLDVPRSPASQTGFADMAHAARELATLLDAGVVDDNGLPLAAGSENAVDAQLQRLYAQLAESGLPAGSARSLRVFA